MNTLSIHQFLPHSRANGPGLRAVIWVQGCSLKCPGCFNPETHSSHSFKEGEIVYVDDLVKRIISLHHNIEGITLTGGEPFQQILATSSLLRKIKKLTSLSVIVFTGLRWEVIRQPIADNFYGCIDVVIAGPYDKSQHLGQGLLGSANKTVHFLTNRYTMSDLEAVPPAEVIINPGGEVILSGINPLRKEP